MKKDLGIVIYGRTEPACKFCVKAKKALDEAGIGYKFVNVPQNPDLLEFFRTKHTAVPQVYRDGVHLGGSEAAIELVADQNALVSDDFEW